jgi:hypothetical protein
MYLCSLVTENSENSTEIKIRIAAGNILYFFLIKLLKSRAVARNTKVRMYRTIIIPVVTYGSETWCLSQVYGNGIWRIRTNKELMALYQN